MALPNEVDGKYKRYEGFKFNQNSNQYALQQLAYTDELGFRRIDVEGLNEPAYMAALGSYYTQEDSRGVVFYVKQANNYNYYVVAGDMKADRDTNSTSQYTYAPNDSPQHNIDETNADIIEFIMDTSNRSAKHIKEIIKHGVISDATPSYSKMYSPITEIIKLDMPTVLENRGDN